MTTQSLSYVTTSTFENIADRIRCANRIVVTTHRKPDGDAIGSVVGMYRALRSLGKEVENLIIGPLEHGLAIIAGDTPIRFVEESGVPEEAPDLIIVLDTGAWSQLEAIEPWLREHAELVIGLDHHANGDDVAGDRIVDVSAAAATQVVLELLETMDIDIGSGTGCIAEALFVGLATDTGWFRFSNADARCFADASKLLQHDLNRYDIYRSLEETARPARMALLQRMLASLEIVGNVAIMVLRSTDFGEAKGDSTDLVGLVNTPMVIEGVQASILLTDSNPGITKMSFRSKPALVNDPTSLIDVNKLASEFGGGGHVHAAGARVKEPLEAVKTRLLEQIT
ncbi:MAG: bifunctional oligoribonuclease/PAP phosphatase NrnA [Phycisphaerales bacterium]|jgi:phosphoesterase RecJ-like protein|nr:bifunctional oligoribonuclease/PAP phosphatase NrnA [Phycisphaerales bacterium]